ncbi:hypothetical protein CVT24_011775 [Panaeolus cyanescens]|uniref:Uncharacterized protein n=1 Tax=Panaeolus cyanescens TaxID=181874 RepID=A0A409VHH9_9AGAR|nr:hypothetical protein CVT24_011775 [Panaeolus cyanescens]
MVYEKHTSSLPTIPPTPLDAPPAYLESNIELDRSLPPIPLDRDTRELLHQPAGTGPISLPAEDTDLTSSSSSTAQATVTSILGALQSLSRSTTPNPERKPRDPTLKHRSSYSFGSSSRGAISLSGNENAGRPPGSIVIGGGRPIPGSLGEGIAFGGGQPIPAHHVAAVAAGSAVGPSSSIVIGAGQPIPVGDMSSAKGHGHKRSLSSSSISSLKATKKTSWFNLKIPLAGAVAGSIATGINIGGSTQAGPISTSSSQVKTTVQGLVRDLVQDHSSSDTLSAAAQGILLSCSEACNAHSLSFSSILQERFIESHSPLYWAVIKRAKHNPQEGRGDLLGDDIDNEGDRQKAESDLLTSLLRHALKPLLDSETIAELRLACLATSDQDVFQRLRNLVPQFSTSRSIGADQVLLGASPSSKGITDEVWVEIGPGTEGAFAATFSIPQFHKRMMISKEVDLEFVARNRIWRFALLICPDNAWYGPPPGSWCASIELVDSSPPTWFDGRLVFADNHLLSGSTSPTQKHIRLKSKQQLDAPRNGIPATQIIASLDEAPNFASLQYSGSPFIGVDDTLRIKLEARLSKPEPSGSEECIVS